MASHLSGWDAITQEGGPKEHREKQNGRMQLILLHMYQGTFTPSIKPNLGLSHTHPPLTSTINILQTIWY